LIEWEEMMLKEKVEEVDTKKREIAEMKERMGSEGEKMVDRKIEGKWKEGQLEHSGCNSLAVDVKSCGHTS
jgi:hypothetical protein